MSTIETDDISTAVSLLSPEVPVDQVLETLQKLDWMKAKEKELRASLEDAMIGWINANGPIEFGTIRYYVGPEKKTKCRDQQATADAILTACGGDWERFASCLASGAFKHGAVKTLLLQAETPEKYEELFEIIETQELKEGKPVTVKKLHKVDERFIK